MRTDAPAEPTASEEPLGGPPLRPPKRAELLADNKQFVAIATDLLYAMRKTADGSCAFCGAPVGQQHRRGRICFRLVLWRSKTQYKYKSDT
jgi:hypothetical protein